MERLKTLCGIDNRRKLRVELCRLEELGRACLACTLVIRKKSTNSDFTYACRCCTKFTGMRIKTEGITTHIHSVTSGSICRI